MLKNRKLLLEGSGAIVVKDIDIDPDHGDYILVQTAFSVISSGTEGSAISLGSKPVRLLRKVSRDRAKAKQLIGVAAQRGVSGALQIVNDKINQETELGYSCSGYVINDPSGKYVPGEPIALMGVGLATHADYNFVSHAMSSAFAGSDAQMDTLAFGGISCICINALRRSQLQPGSEVAIIGLGLLGQISMIIAREMGLFPVGYDVDIRRVNEVRKLGMEAYHTTNIGSLSNKEYPAAIVCASTSNANLLAECCSLLSRKGKLILVGDVPIQFPREAIYKKEIDFLISTSYGPGRYDEAFESDLTTYPKGFVPWTQTDNLRYFSKLVAKGLDLTPLIAKRFSLDEASLAFSFLKTDDFKNSNGVALLLSYGANLRSPQLNSASRLLSLEPTSRVDRDAKIGSKISSDGKFHSIGLVGAGAFARGNYIPFIKKNPKLQLLGVTSGRGVNAAAVARGFANCTQYSNLQDMLKKEKFNSIVVATRNNLHATQAIECAEAGVRCLVEKPVCTTLEEVRSLEPYVVHEKIFVGFNRRFAPKLLQAKSKISYTSPLQIIQDVNVGDISSHWSSEPTYGGRIVSEAVHFIDLGNWLVRSRIQSIFGFFPKAEDPQAPNQGQIIVKYECGSTNTINYKHSMPSSLPKETLTIIDGSKVIVIHECKRMNIYEKSKKKQLSSYFVQDKGNWGLMQAFFVPSPNGEPLPTLYDGLLATIIVEMAKRSHKDNCWINFDNFLQDNCIGFI
jgi:predicted dehydrogenase